MGRYCLNHFDAIVYINLDHRVDRREELLEELKSAGVDENRLFRIKGVYEPCLGHRGCLHSHIKALEFAKERGFENVLILEDDCFFKRDPRGADEVIRYLLDNLYQWDVLLLGTCVRAHHLTPWEGIYRVLWSSSAQAYAVDNHYYDTLLNYYKSLHAEMEGNIFTAKRLQFDFKWHELMVDDRWYCSDIILQQRPSYSDIDNGWKERLHPEKVTDNVEYDIDVA